MTWLAWLDGPSHRLEGGRKGAPLLYTISLGCHPSLRSGSGLMGGEMLRCSIRFAQDKAQDDSGAVLVYMWGEAKGSNVSGV
jgi:hypothetical protein